MPSVDWIYIVVVVAIGLFGDMIILSVKRQHREEERRQAELSGGHAPTPAGGSHH